MTRPVVWIALAGVIGCGGETREQTDLNSERIAALEEELAAMEERLLAAEGGVQANTTAVADAATQATEARQAAEEAAAAIEDLTVRVDGHDLAVSEAAGLVAGLESRLLDPVYGEVVLLQSDLAQVGVDLVNQQAAVDAANATAAATAAATADLGATVTGLEATVATHGFDLADQAVELTSQRADLDALAADVVDLENTVGFHDAAIVGLQGDVTSAQSDLAALQSQVDQNTVDLAAIQTNLVPPVEDLLVYLSADTSTDTVSLTAGDLAVDGRVLSDNLSFRRCGGYYQCTPLLCLAECQANGERMATTDEVLAWASRGQDRCEYLWMLDRNNPLVPVRSFPMYTNQVNQGCGALNTGNEPRLAVGPILATGWDDPTSNSNCACAAL